MKIALVCDDLISHGGHENIVMEFCEIFPEATLYTSYISKDWQKICSDKGIKVITSFLQKFPFVDKLNRYYAPFLFHILALESFNFDDHDLVISISSRFAHGILTKPGTLHICYMSTVGRMFWESNDYFKHESSGLLKYFKISARIFLAPLLSYIRIWDRTASTRVDHFIANSKTTYDRIKKYYHRESEIIHPCIDFERIERTCQKYISDKKDDYFIILTRLVSWKRVDYAIETCKKLQLKLKIIGFGPDIHRLKKIAANDTSIEFCGFVDFDKKIKLILDSKALINTQKEDFGIAPLEAMACGKGIIAYKEGGVLETVIENKTGIFFEHQTSDDLCLALKKFNASKFLVEDCIKQAKLFDKEIFKEKILKFTNNSRDVPLI